MNVGIWIRPGYTPQTGGGYSYYQTLIESFISKNGLRSDISYCFISPETKPSSHANNTVYLGLIPRLFIHNIFLQKLFFLVNVRLLSFVWKKRIKESKISLIYYINPDDLKIPIIPFITTLWDLGYYVTYPFPELISGNNFNGRKKMIEKELKKALMVFSESETGKKDLVKYANVWEGKIRVVPMFPGDVANLNLPHERQKEILNSFKLNSYEYFFYPAQYWAHKNHKTVLKAFSLYIKQNPSCILVLTGADKGNKDYVVNLCEELAIKKNVIVGGFVSLEELYTLYTNALATIMASFFGPTNMPPIEAMHLSCPVICSDIEGHREILGDAGLYFDALNFNALLNQMIKIALERDVYVERIKHRIQTTKFTKENALACIDKYMLEAESIRAQWKQI